MTLFVGLLWDGYSVVSDVPSELSAIGAPTRQLWTWLGALYAVLMAAFGWVVWKSAPPNHPLRVVGALLMAHAVFGQFWPPMHQRAVLAAGGGTLTDTLHLVWATITAFFFLLIVGFGAAATEDVQFVADFIDSLFPVMRDGYDFDACVSNADVNDYNLEAIRVPTLIVHTKDDRLASHEASERAAERIPGARFVSLESGGHLMLGQTKIIREELADFFVESGTRRTERAAS